MTKYICVNCNYKFESGNPSECPYCGTEDFDIDEDSKNGYCIVGCGTWFTINKETGETKEVGTTQTEVSL